MLFVLFLSTTFSVCDVENQESEGHETWRNAKKFLSVFGPIAIPSILLGVFLMMVKNLRDHGGPLDKQLLPNCFGFGMTSVWKRLQRVNKHAARFQFSISYQQLTLETTSKWVPNKLSMVWMRKSRRVVSQPLRWEPTLEQPLKGIVLWTVPESHQITVTLFKNSRNNELEDKYWSFVVEDVSTNGKRRKLAITRINMRNYANFESTKHQLDLNFTPVTKKITAARLECSLMCIFLKEGKATDEDMLSMVSLMSMSVHNNDIAYLDDLEDDEHLSNSNNNNNNNRLLSSHLNEVTEKLADLTQHLSDADTLDTPQSEINNLSSISCHDEKTPVIERPVPSYMKIPKPNATDFTSHFLISDPYSEICTEQLDSLVVEEVEDDDDYIHINEDHIETSTPSKPKLQLPDNDNDNDNRNTSSSGGQKLSTPGQDLLEWCQDMLSEFPNVNVTNLTTSWRNGIAFCALIHKIQPILIPDLDSLSPQNIRENCRRAFAAGSAIGIPKIIEPTDMDMLAVPDKLAVMTYLFQLRAFFTGHQFEIKEIGKTSNESSYTIGKFHTDTDTDVSNQLFEKEILNLRHSQSNRNLVNGSQTDETEVKNKKNLRLSLSNNHNEMMDSNKNQIPVKHGDQNSNRNSPRSPSSPAKDSRNGIHHNKIPLKPYILVRHDELKEKAKALLENANKEKSSSTTPVSEEDKLLVRQKEAKQLISEIRKNSLKSPTHRPKHKNINENLEQNGNIYDNPLLSNDVSSQDVNINDNEKPNDVSTYIDSEYNALDREQCAIDTEAAALEKKLRTVMESQLADPDEEDSLMSQWFTLVNKKNALIRRQMQLNLLEKEEDLEKKYEMLNDELRSILAIDDCAKTEVQRRREALLLDELVQIVNKRNELVHHIDSQEKAIEDDDLIEHDLSQIELQRRQNCILQ